MAELSKQEQKKLKQAQLKLDRSFDTVAVHGAHTVDTATGSCALPIYQTAAYAFESTQHAKDLFDLKAAGNIYSRLTNPTVDTLGAQIATLHGGVHGVALASGHSAEILAFLNLCKAGDSIVSANSLYGGTWNILLHTFANLGITARFAESYDVDGFVKATDETTKCWYVETIGNPRLDVADIPALAEAARSCGVPLIVDNTFATPYLCRPFEHGAAVVLESLTKWIGGHGTSMGGCVIDGGTFDWTAFPGKFPTMTEPDPNYHDLVFTDTFGNAAYGMRIQTQMLRDFGPSLSPFNAQQIMLGVETLGLRMQRHSDNAMAVARYLEAHPLVTWVSYPGLEGHPSHEIATRVLKHGFGGCVVFGVKGGRAAGAKFIDSLKMIVHLANVGDAKSLVIHPASTTHSQLSADQLVEAGISEDLIRLSVGIEFIDDIIDDLEQALKASQE